MKLYADGRSSAKCDGCGKSWRRSYLSGYGMLYKALRRAGWHVVRRELEARIKDRNTLDQHYCPNCTPPEADERTSLPKGDAQPNSNTKDSNA